MKRAVLVLALVLAARPAAAHVGSPDVFYEGNAGPYPVFVSIRMPEVIPGVATIEIRARTPDATSMTVVPMRLTGPGSEYPPTPDSASRSAADPQFFTAGLWLMESGALQVKVSVDGARGPGELAVPIPALATRSLAMDRALGTALFGLMALLALALVSIAGAAAREAALEPDAAPDPRVRRRSRIATAIAAVVVVVVIAFGNRWWNAEARAFERMIGRPWTLEPRLDGCRLTLPQIRAALLPDHGHDVHLFVVRVPAMDRLAHLHPTLATDGSYVQDLPSLPAGRYALFADIVLSSGFPVTGTGAIDVPDLACPPLGGDDASWSAAAPSTSIVFDPPPELHARRPVSLAFRVVDATGAPATDVEPYMAMAGHAAVIRADLGVFAHLHPSGTVAMPAMMLAGTPHVMYADRTAVPPSLSFPYGFPSSGRYRIFVQVKRAGEIHTGAFDLDVLP